MNNQKILKTDVLVLGTGIAGCSIALKLAENKKIKILLVSKDKDIKQSSTLRAQGGIIARGPNDSKEKLKKDILVAGDGLCNEKAVDILAEEGPGLVEKMLIKKAGVEFNRSKEKLDYTREAAHSESRILYRDDHTGEEIEKKLTRLLEKNKNIKILTNHTLIDLLTLSHHAMDRRKIYQNNKCVGCYLLDNQNSLVKTVLAKKTVLATGGIGQVYLRTTNPNIATGDGLATASRAGVEIINAEYMQFHPTSLFHRDADNFLISESVRGEGAKLKNEKGNLFMKKYDKRGSLAPRDIVARGIYEEILNSKKDHVYLDLISYMDRKYTKKRFPLIYETCLKYNIDITKEMIPVAPTAHYFCGGIRVDEFAQSSLESLYAIGEVSCTGVHGANRLASTSLLEGLVWANRCAKDISKKISNGELTQNRDIKPWIYIGNQTVDPALIKQDWMSVKSIMWNYVGIIRTEERLERAVLDLNYLKHRIEKFYQNVCLSKDLLELRNGIQTALIVAEAAKQNRWSMGCHYRSL
ncbi:MAG: L-aspartate oxidase [Candidatus Aenigmarchaeota archaeon]|nr:L-aspartate oxidase [Candidatus Aenigmarchaeota archaeon]